MFDTLNIISPHFTGCRISPYGGFFSWSRKRSVCVNSESQNAYRVFMKAHMLNWFWSWKLTWQGAKKQQLKWKLRHDGSPHDGEWKNGHWCFKKTNTFQWKVSCVTTWLFAVARNVLPCFVICRCFNQSVFWYMDMVNMNNALIFCNHPAAMSQHSSVRMWQRVLMCRPCFCFHRQQGA